MITTNSSANLSTPNPLPLQLRDKFGRKVDYLRLAVTDRCNLRCIYCMPEQGIQYFPRKEILTYEESLRLVRVLSEMGVNKVRITGGEPFVRKGLIDFLQQLRSIPAIEKINITTNGVLTAEYLPALKQLPINGINLSLDTMDPEHFKQMTRRDHFDTVLDCFHRILEYEIPLKVNAVIIDGKNADQIIPLSRLAEHHPVSVRFIEEMPFNGSGVGKDYLAWNHRQIYEVLSAEYPGIQRLEDEPTSTSMTYAIPGFRGTVGIIAGFSRTFCGACNRIRINARGMIQNCLYGEGLLNLKSLIERGESDDDLKRAIAAVVDKKYRDGWIAEKQRRRSSVSAESMSSIGG